MSHLLRLRPLGVTLFSMGGLTLASAAAAQGEGAAIVFHFPAFVLFLVVLGALAAAVVAVVGHRLAWAPRITGTCALIAIFTGLLIAPSMALDRVTVTSTGIEQRTGLWFAQREKGFKYADVASIQIGERRGRRRTEMIWNVRHKDGSVNVLDPGDLWEMNSNQIVPLLERYGVTFE